MIGKMKQQISLRFKKFIIFFTVALIFEPIYHLTDSLSNCLRFG